MRVLFINTVYGRGSTGRIISDIGQMLEDNGHEFKVAYGRGSHSTDSHCYRIGNDLDMYLHAGLSRITDKAGFYSKRATRKLVEFIRKYEPDVINLHNLHGYYVNLEILFNYLAEEFKGQVVWTLHDCWAFTGHCVHYTYAKCEKWKTGCDNCSEKKRYPKSLFRDNSAENYKKKKELISRLRNLVIVTPSKWLAEQVKLSFIQPKSIVVINNGIDLGVFQNKGLKREHIILNVTDGLDDRKGFGDLIKLHQLLPWEYKIVIVGVTLPAGFKQIDGMEFVKRTDSVAELVDFYNKSEFLVNPTYEDTFPTVNMEAIACGLPVITYASGGSPESVPPGSGFVVPPGEIELIAKIIKNTQQGFAKCSEQALRFDKYIKYQEYIDLFEKNMKTHV